MISGVASGIFRTKRPFVGRMCVSYSDGNDSVAVAVTQNEPPSVTAGWVANIDFGRLFR